MAPDPIDDRDDTQGSSPESLLQFLSHHRQRSQRRREPSRRFRKRPRVILALLAILLASGLVAINVLIWGNFTHLRFVSRTPVATTTSPEDQVATSRHRGQTPTPLHVDRGGKPLDRKGPQPKSTRVLLTAVRNDSWVEIRAGSSTGRVLFDGVVSEGRSIRVAGRRLWARFGSLGNFDLTINGRPVHPALNGTVDTVITAAAIRPVSTQTG